MESMESPAEGVRKARSSEYLGTLAAVATYALWGLLPLFWKRLAEVEVLQVLGHRIIWGAIFTIGILALQGRLGDLAALFRDRKRFLAAATAAVLITVNWGTYIWAVDNGHVTESALGYFINPLLSVAMGALFFRERMDRWTVAAVSIAAAGVLVASLMLGRPPVIALVLAASFGTYGFVKKKTGLDPVVGLAAETIVVAPLALAWIASRHLAGQGTFGSDPASTLMLVLAGPVTALPLLAFAFATNHITLQRLGFIQYISPSIKMALGVIVYREGLSPSLLVSFATVIAAVLIYAISRFRREDPPRRDARSLPPSP